MSVLRDWNSGKISYFSVPPAVHPSSMPQAQPTLDSNDVAMNGDQVGDAKILNDLSEAFTLDGLFDQAGEEAEWAGGEDDEGIAVEEGVDDETPHPPETIVRAVPPVAASDVKAATRSVPPPSMLLDSDSEAEDGPDFAMSPSVDMDDRSVTSKAASKLSTARLFTSEELAMLPPSVLNRQRTKAQARKAKKRQAAAERTEGELMIDFMDMGLERRAVDQYALPSKKQKAKAKKARDQAERIRALPSDREADDQTLKELEFAKFLSNVGVGTCHSENSDCASRLT